VDVGQAEVSVENEHAVSEAPGRDGEVDGGQRLADPTFAASDANDAAGSDLSVAVPHCCLHRLDAENSLNYSFTCRALQILGDLLADREETKWKTPLFRLIEDLPKCPALIQLCEH